MSFDLQAFIAAPSQELLNVAKKSDLLDIAAHYELTTVNKFMLKQEIKNILVQFLVDKEILDSSALSLVLVTQTGLQMRELEIQRQIEFEKLRLEQERQMQKERLEMEEREREKERQIQIEREKLKFDAELRMKELEIQNMTVKRQPLDSGTHFDVTKHIRLVPPFQEKEVDKYFLHFEKVAENLKWPKEHWTLLLQSVIIGKAREICTQLTVEQSSSYDTVKELILKAYELVPEAYGQKFRNCKKENEQTHVEFARTKEQLFDRWCSSKTIGSNHEKLRQLMLVEEFKRCINSDIKSFLDEKQVETLEAAARLADDYALTHKVSFINKSNPSRRPFFPQSGSKHSPSNPSGNYSQTFTPKPKSSGENKDQNPLSQPICNYCKRTGHIISECLHLKRKKEKQEGLKPTGLTSLRSKPQSCVKEEDPIQTERPETDSVMEIYEPFLSDGFVSLNSDYAQSTPIKILRDTGASQSLILADTLPFSEKTSSGTSVLIQGVECGFVNVPLHNIYLSSDLVTGLVAVGVRPSLPFKGVHLLLGNDLAGDKVVVNPLLTNIPCIDQPPDPIEQEIPDLYPSCAVTRAMAKKAKQNDGDIDLTDTFLGQSFKHEITNSLSSSLSDKQTELHNKSESSHYSAILNDQGQGHDLVSRSQLCKEQHNDPEILPLLERALDEKEIDRPSLFLCQKWHFNEKMAPSWCLSRRRVDC